MTKPASIKGITDMVGSHLAVFIKDHLEWESYRLHRLFSPLVNYKKVIDSERLAAINVELQLSTKKKI